MSKRESIRKEAEKLGVSPSAIWRKRRSQNRINQVGGDLDIVYAWRWSNDNTCAKIGVSKMSNLEDRMAATYHPTDDPVLIGVIKCPDREAAKAIESCILNRLLERTRPDREWVIIDKDFNEILDEVFLSDSNVLCEIFGGHIKTEKSYNENS